MTYEEAVGFYYKWHEDEHGIPMQPNVHSSTYRTGNWYLRSGDRFLKRVGPKLAIELAIRDAPWEFTESLSYLEPLLSRKWAVLT